MQKTGKRIIYFMCAMIMACVFIAGGYLFISGANYIEETTQTIEIPKVDPNLDPETPPIDPELDPETPPEDPEQDPGTPPEDPEQDPETPPEDPEQDPETPPSNPSDDPETPGGSSGGGGGSEGDTGSGSGTGEGDDDGNNGGSGGGGGGSDNDDGSGSGTGDGDDDGNNGGSGGGGGSGGSPIDPKAWFRIKDSKGGLIYLRSDSYGNYTGTGEHGFIANDKYYVRANEINPLNYFSICLEASGYSEENAEIVLNLEKAELLPYYPYERVDSDAGKMQYKVYYYPYEYSYLTISNIKRLSEINSSYAEQELTYREFVYEQYLGISDDLKQFLLEKGASANISSSDQDIVEKIAFFIQTSADYDMDWGTTNYPNGTDMVKYFFEIKEGVCRHYAAAATMMFRAYGIPARYTIGYAINTPENEWFDYDEAGHAWVEIYIDGLGWVKVEVTGSDNIPDDGAEEDGGDTGGSDTIKPGDGTGDGTGGSGDGSGEGGNGSGSGDGSGESGNGSGSGDGSGEGGNGSGSGDDGSDAPTDPNNYVIKVKTFDATKTYDGITLVGDYDITIPDELDTNRYLIRVENTTDIINVEEKVNIVEISVFDTTLNTVAKNVKIVYEYGKLTIYRKQIVITTGSKSASIEETSVLEYREYTVSGLLTNDKITNIDFAKQEGVGATANSVDLSSIIIKNNQNEDVTNNYTVLVKEGYLLIYDNN